MKIKSLLFVIALISLAGCKAVPERGSATTPDKTSTPQINLPVLLTRWEIIGNPSFSQNSFTLDIHGFGLINHRILIFYSLSGSSSVEIASGEIFQIVDNTGSVSQLTEIIPLSKFDALELGLMVFEPRQIGVNELFLIMSPKSDQNATQKLLLARFIGSAGDDFFGREFWGATKTESELAGYRISIIGGIPSENQSATVSPGILEATSTPVLENYPTETAVILKSSIPLTPGVTVLDEISFKMENKANGQIQYQGVQLLSDGTFIGVVKGVSAWLTPIVLITPVIQPPSSTAYP